MGTFYKFKYIDTIYNVDANGQKVKEAVVTASSDLHYGKLPETNITEYPNSTVESIAVALDSNTVKKKDLDDLPANEYAEWIRDHILPKKYNEVEGNCSIVEILS